MITASQLKAGMAGRIAAQIYKALEAEFKAGAGQAGGVVKTKLRSVSSGRMWEPHFRPEERLEELDLERQTMEFLYSDAENCTFMNPRTFDQMEIPRAILGPAERFLKEGMQVPVEFFDGRPISIVFPAVVEARGRYCAAGAFPAGQHLEGSHARKRFAPPRAAVHRQG